FKILEEGIAQRASDIDVVYVNGYGFPAYRGGPMFLAEQMGFETVLNKINEYRSTLDPDNWQPSSLLESRVSAS
ncbi:3-hydroxyacyl-CoA dehydrogenase family protein, partial [Oceanospirillum sp. HFRX-1_2]